MYSSQLVQVNKKNENVKEKLICKLQEDKVKESMKNYRHIISMVADVGETKP